MFIKSFKKIAEETMMSRFATSALNAFGGATPKKLNIPKPPVAPQNVQAGQTINSKIGNPFG